MVQYDATNIDFPCRLHMIEKKVQSLDCDSKSCEEKEIQSHF